MRPAATVNGWSSERQIDSPKDAFEGNVNNVPCLVVWGGAGWRERRDASCPNYPQNPGFNVFSMSFGGLLEDLLAVPTQHCAPELIKHRLD